jgi:hypothetical protein
MSVIDRVTGADGVCGGEIGDCCDGDSRSCGVNGDGVVRRRRAGVVGSIGCGGIEVVGGAVRESRCDEAPVPIVVREALGNELSRRASSLDLSLINILIADRA